MENSFCTAQSVRHLCSEAYPIDGYLTLPLLGDPPLPAGE